MERWITCEMRRTSIAPEIFRYGDNFCPGQEVTTQVIQPESMASCIQVGIALAINNCENGICPAPAEALGCVLYAGPWTPEDHQSGGFFTVTLPSYLGDDPAISTLTHLCPLGARELQFIAIIH
ncbi:hypothetical protein AZE42_10530 [Rhizopogon vesiculosus]|uniref:Uncharacterized protein n=1 Tax=Rhizopogon vesiculosus TaxID=180088 RepID=A0A1J8Q7K7_9AGAM|nr:hypothetical protein AZE42_10530 [Rhizopogon vesiculosus]